MSSFAASGAPSTSTAPGWTRLITPLRVVVILWIAVLIWYLRYKGHDIPLLNTVDPDDALRLVQVRDLLGGQAWWDVSQHRINPLNGGGLMHWSRIVDTPIALGIWLLTPLLGAARAEYVWIAVWPMLLLLFVLMIMAHACRRFGDWRLPYVAPLLVATNVIILFQFAPLRIDHHGWQFMLSLIALGFISRPPSARSGMLAALACATLVAISLEGLPMVALLAAILALDWWWSGDRTALDRLRAYLLTLTIAAIGWQFITRGPIGLTSDWCDSLSRPYIGAFAVATISIGGGSLLLGRYRNNRWLRLGFLGLCGAASAATLLLIAPACINGPFGQLDPVVQAYWYNNVREGQPIWKFWDAFAINNITPSLLGIIGMAIGWWSARDNEHRRVWLVWLSALLGATILSLLVNRTASLAQMIAAPGLAMLGVAIFTWARQLKFVPLRIVATAASAIVVPPVIGMVAAFVITSAAPSMSRTRSAAMPRGVCAITSRSMATLAEMPPMLLYAPLDLGPHILQRTHHSVLATGHHRNNAIMSQVLSGFLAPPDRAEAIIRATRAPVVLICPHSPEFRNLMIPAGPSLAKDLAANKAPAWLEPIPLGPNTDLRAWRVVPRSTDDIQP